MSEHILTVAVVGMGPTGVAATAALADAVRASDLSAPLRLVLIDPEPVWGPGTAFTTPLPAHVMNMRSVTLSLDAQRPGDFATWAEERGCHDEYPARRVFGEYASTVVRRAVAMHAALGNTIDAVHDRVTDIFPEEDRLCLLTSGGVVAADAVLMCVGEGGEGAFADFGGMRGFIPGLWATEQIASIPRQTKVAVAGTSLSAVDVVGQLRAQGHEGPIYACARTRGLPKVQGPREGYTMRTLTDEWRSRHCATSDALPIAVVARGLRDELDHAIGRPYDPSRVDPREIFSRRDRQARSALPELAVLSESITQANTGNHWASVMEALGEMTPSVWHAIAMEDRAQFLRARYGIWSEYRHPIPLQNAEMLRDAMTDGQLTVHKGVQSVRPYGSGWRTTTAGTDITSDYLVDVTGFHLPRRLNRHKLLSSMLDRQMLSPHPLGGVRVDIDTCRVQSPVGAPTLALYVAGALTVGTHLYTNALETNVANATRAAHDLVHALTAANPLRRERSGHERAPVRYA